MVPQRPKKSVAIDIKLVLAGRRRLTSRTRKAQTVMMNQQSIISSEALRNPAFALWVKRAFLRPVNLIFFLVD